MGAAPGSSSARLTRDSFVTLNSNPFVVDLSGFEIIAFNFGNRIQRDVQDVEEVLVYSARTAQNLLPTSLSINGFRAILPPKRHLAISPNGRTSNWGKRSCARGLQTSCPISGSAVCLMRQSTYFPPSTYFTRSLPSVKVRAGQQTFHGLRYNH